MEREPDQLVGLDDLFDRFAPQPPPRRRLAESEPYGVGWWLKRIAIALVVGGALWAAAYSLRVDISYPFLAACVLGAAVLREALQEVGSMALPRELTGEDRETYVVDSVGVAHDGLQIATGRWRSRLAWGERDRDRFLTTVAPRIGELVDERLRLRHGITRASDPVRARRLLGEDVWAFLHNPPGRTVGPRDVTSVVAKVEEL